jgi:hypothetical protein
VRNRLLGLDTQGRLLRIDAASAQATLLDETGILNPAGAAFRD